MSYRANPSAFLEIQKATARGLLRAALYFQAEHMQRIGTMYPPASRPGEYLRKRTGQGQAGLTLSANSPDAVVRAGLVVRIGFTANARHMLIWEFKADAKKRRLGLLKTLDDLRPKLVALALGDRP